MDDFSKYEEMRRRGATPGEVYLTAKSDGADWLFCIRLLRKLFNLGLAEAKEITIVASGEASSLAEYQDRFVEPLQKLLDESEKQSEKNRESGSPEV